MTTKPLKIFSLLLIAALAPARSSGAGDATFLERYKAGLYAIEAEDWPRAAELMRQAIGERGEASRRLPKYLYLKPYLPHFYLGLADFKRGDCRAALRSWSISEAQGVVRKRPQYEQIELARELCRSRKRAPAPTRTVPSAPASEAAPRSGPRPVETAVPPAAARPAPAHKPGPAPAGQPPAPPADHDFVPRRLEARRLETPAEPPAAGLLATAAALFDGSYQQVVDQLSAEPPADAYSRAHAELLLAAAELALYLKSGERVVDRLESARRHVLEVRAALPDLEPPERFFSPRFLDFFYGQRPQEER